MSAMKNTIFASLIFASFFATEARAEKQEFKRYQTIIDRQPFGQPPAGFNPQKMASEVTKGDSEASVALSPEQEAIKKAISFSVLNLEDDVVMVGFSDRENPNSPKYYYLAEGEAQDGWLVKACDLEKEEVIFEKDGVEVTLRLGDASDKGGSAAPRPRLLAQPAAQANEASAAPAFANGKGAKRNVLGESFTGRRKRRQQEEAAEAERVKAREAREKERERLAAEKAEREAAEKAANEQRLADLQKAVQESQKEVQKLREENEQKKEDSAQQSDQQESE